MKVFISVLTVRVLSFILKLFKKNGTVYPGYIIYDFFDKKILDKIKLPKHVIAVTGSSGKGSTTELIAHILKENGHDVIYNKSGSNGVLGAVTLILKHCTLSGKFKHEVLVLECDERHLKLIFKNQKMSHLVLTNITRDQPSRNSHPNFIFEEIVGVIDKDTKIILNADDPLLNSLKNKYKKIVTFGINETEDSTKTIKLNANDTQYCPICNKKLKYKYFHYGNIGNYECLHCSFKRGNANYEVKSVDYKKMQLNINGSIVDLNKNALFAVYYTVAAFAVTSELDIPTKGILKALNENKMKNKRGKSLSIDGRDLIMLETKNENALSYYQSLKIITKDKTPKTVIMGFENVSRRYKFNDLSWLYDVEFEMLKEKCVDKIIVIGRFRYDVATRFAYAGIDESKIILVDDLDKVVDHIKTTKGELYTMVCFDMTELLRNKIERYNNENN